MRLIKPPLRTREDVKTRKATMVIGAEARNDVGMKTRREVREAVAELQSRVEAQHAWQLAWAWLWVSVQAVAEPKPREQGMEQRA